MSDKIIDSIQKYYKIVFLSKYNVVYYSVYVFDNKWINTTTDNRIIIKI